MQELIRIENIPVYVNDEVTLVSLTSIWRASKSPASKRPADWLRLVSAKALMNMEKNDVVNPHYGSVSIRGGDPYDPDAQGTWRSPWVAFGYAVYVNKPLAYSIWNALFEQAKKASSLTRGERGQLEYFRKKYETAAAYSDKGEETVPDHLDPYRGRRKLT